MPLPECGNYDTVAVLTVIMFDACTSEGTITQVASLDFWVDFDFVTCDGVSRG